MDEISIISILIAAVIGALATYIYLQNYKINFQIYVKKTLPFQHVLKLSNKTTMKTLQH